jgi:hypothetical protein
MFDPLPTCRTKVMEQSPLISENSVLASAEQDTSIWSAGYELLAQSQQLAWFSDKPLAVS